MPLLDAALAFALTMLAVATVVTVAVQIVQDILRIRARTLRRTLERYFDEDVKPILQREATAALGTAMASAAAFTAHLAKDPARGAIADSVAKVITPSLTKLPAADFLQRLRTSDLGQEIVKAAGSKAEAVFTQLEARYEIAADAASDLFARKARWFSILIAFLIAVWANVDSIRLLNRYMSDESARGAVIAQKDALVKEFQNLQTKLNETTTASAAKPAKETDDAIKNIQKRISDAQASLRGFERQGFPIGQSLFPFCPSSSTDTQCVEFRKLLAESMKSGTINAYEFFGETKPAEETSQKQDQKPGTENKPAAAPSGDKKAAQSKGAASGTGAGQSKAAKEPICAPSPAQAFTIDQCIDRADSIWNAMRYGGRLFWTWLFGILVTTLLLGLGAPFWYDVVRGIAQAAQQLSGAGRAAKPEPGAAGQRR